MTEVSPTEPNVLLRTGALLRRLLGQAWLPALMLYFVWIGGTFYGSLSGGLTLVNLWLTIALLAATIVGRLRRGLPALPRTPLDLLLILWAGLLLVSTAMSVCRRLSFDVSLQQLWYFGLFYLAVAVGSTAAGRRRMGAALTVACVGAAVVGLGQFAQWLADPARDMSGAGQRVVQSTFNNPNDFASFLTMLLPLAFAGVVVVGRPAVRRAAATALFLAMFGCLVLTYSRGGWLSGPLSLALLVALVLRSERLPRFRQLFTHNKALLCLLVAGFALMLRFSPQGWLSYRLASLVKLRDPGVSQRMITWRAVRQMAADRPWLGWGGGTLPLRFTAYLQPAQSRELALHAHNQYLHFAAETGLPSAVVFVACSLVALGAGWRRRRAERSAPDLLRAASMAGVGAHLLFLVFNAESALPSLAGTYWMLLGVTVAHEETPAHSSRRSTTCLLVLAALAACGLAILLSRFCLAQQRYEASVHAASPRAARAALLRATQLDPRHPAYRAALARSWWRDDKPRRAVEAMRAATSRSPHDALFWHNLAWLQFFADGPGDQPIATMEQALARDPSMPFYQLSLADMQREAGWLAEAEQTLRKAGESAYDLPETHWLLGKLLFSVGRHEEASRELEACLARLHALRPGYQVGVRYRRLPPETEVITGLQLPKGEGEVRELLQKCRNAAIPAHVQEQREGDTSAETEAAAP